MAVIRRGWSNPSAHPGVLTWTPPAGLTSIYTTERKHGRSDGCGKGLNKLSFKGCEELIGFNKWAGFAWISCGWTFYFLKCYVYMLTCRPMFCASNSFHSESCLNYNAGLLIFTNGKCCQLLKHTTLHKSIFSLSVHYILSRALRDIVDQVQTDEHGRPNGTILSQV